ncbi:MAG TPA: glycoside hydrolase family 10 protein [Cyanophyceae cyanobacterium]
MLSGKPSTKRRTYKIWLIYLLSLVLAIQLFASPNQLKADSTASPTTTELRGVWLTNVASFVLFLPWGINRALHQLSQLHFNTVYPVVWNRGHTFYSSAVAQRVTGDAQDSLLTQLRLGQDVFAEIVKQGKQQNLRIIPWFEYGFMAPAGSTLAKRHPNWITKGQGRTKTLQDIPEELDLVNSTKDVPLFSQVVRQFVHKRLVKNQVWLNPLHPEVQQFILNLIVEVVSKYDVVGIQLDDHFGLPVELGYDAFTIQLYQQEHGGKRPPNNPSDSEWMRWRANKITNFMERLSQAVKVAKPNCLVSLSPNSQSFAYRYYLQDWQTWVQRGLIDELVLQVYRDDLKRFSAELSQPAVQNARRRIPVGIGIMSGTWRRPVAIAQIQKQVQMVRDRGFDGVSFFYWESLWGYITPESPRKRRDTFRKIFS